MNQKIECTVCHKLFKAQRISAKYCSESCKQSAKYRRSNHMATAECDYALIKAENALDGLLRFMDDDSKGNHGKMRISTHLDNLRHILDKTTAKAMVIESENYDRWFQCQNCGQKTFGRATKCDFCNETVFKPVSELTGDIMLRMNTDTKNLF